MHGALREMVAGTKRRTSCNGTRASSLRMMIFFIGRDLGRKPI